MVAADGSRRSGDHKLRGLGRTQVLLALDDVVGDLIFRAQNRQPIGHLDELQVTEGDRPGRLALSKGHHVAEGVLDH
eukprot:3584616-Heterocapsa_arctica.AAC.1